jgi:acetolactate synthase-1/2/3 large subunit
MAKIKVSDYIAEYIYSLGVKDVFLIPGGGNIALVDSINRHESLNFVVNHHEQASAMAAESYGRVGENIGVCTVTFGPGCTNTLNGVVGAWLDSIPVLYLSGQVKRDNMILDSGLRQLGVQEVNIIEMVKPVTKHAAVIMESEEVLYHLEKAVYLAKSGRPGPSFLDIPSDVLSAEIDTETLKHFNPKTEGLEFVGDNLEVKVKQALEMLLTAKRPVIFAGHGINLSKSRVEFLELVEKLQIPVLTSMSALDVIPTNNQLFTGRPGVFGDRAGNFAVQNADLILSLGARHHLWNIGYNYKAFAPRAKKIVVDIDPNELKKKTVIPDLPINANVKDFILEFIKQLELSKLPLNASWNQQCLEWKNKYPVVLPEYQQETEFVNSYVFIKKLSNLLPENSTVVTGVGTSFTGTLQSFEAKNGTRLFCSVGNASMGWDLPAAIGASFVTNKKEIILITGEGSIMMNLQELQTISYHQLPIKIFLLNNNGYLAIKNTINAFFGGKLAGVDESSGISFPSFKKVAETFNLAYETINNHLELENKIKQVLAHKGPIICNINMSPNQPLLPKVYSQKNPDGSMESKSLEDMYPFLDREEYNKNMYN